MMHAADLTKSPRLQRVAELLADGLEHSTMEIVLAAKVMAVSAVISELRTNGFEIVCRRSGDVWYYRQVIKSCPRVWPGDDGSVVQCLERGHCGCAESVR